MEDLPMAWVGFSVVFVLKLDGSWTSMVFREVLIKRAVLKGVLVKFPFNNSHPRSLAPVTPGKATDLAVVSSRVSIKSTLFRSTELASHLGSFEPPIFIFYLSLWEYIIWTIGDGFPPQASSPWKATHRHGIQVASQGQQRSQDGARARHGTGWGSDQRAVLLPRELSHCGIAEHRKPLVHWWRIPTC